MSQLPLSDLQADLRELRRKKLYRCLRPARLRKAGKPSKNHLNFASNDYLSLSRHPEVIEGARRALLEWGAGSGASRLLSGNLLIHEKLEKALATFKKEKTCRIFSSGYLANLGAIGALVNASDVVLFDRLNHASLIDGARLSGAKLWVYPHLDMQTLEGLLSRASSFRRRLVITDAYFSMDGHVAPLQEMTALCAKHNAIFMIDEAHSTGVFGATGGGLTEHFSLSGKIPVVMGTLSKALGSVGGFVAGDSVLQETLTNRCRPFIFTTAPSPAASGAALAALALLQKDPTLIRKLWSHIRWARTQIQKLGFDLMGSEGPILPIGLGDTAKTLKAWSWLRARGIDVAAVRPPTVPQGTDRIRIGLSAAHASADLERLVQALRRLRSVL